MKTKLNSLLLNNKQIILLIFKEVVKIKIFQNYKKKDKIMNLSTILIIKPILLIGKNKLVIALRIFKIYKLILNSLLMVKHYIKNHLINI